MTAAIRATQFSRDYHFLLPNPTVACNVLLNDFPRQWCPCCTITSATGVSIGGHYNATALQHATHKAVSDMAVWDAEVLHSCGCKCSWLSSSHWCTKPASQSFALPKGNAVADVNGTDCCFAVQHLCQSGVVPLCSVPWQCQLQALGP